MFSLPGATVATAGVVFETAPYDWQPSSIFPGYAFDGTTLQIPLADLSDYHLTAATASADRGDARQILASFVQRFEDWLMELVTKPLAATVRTNLRVESSGSFEGKEKQQITFALYTERPAGGIAEEP